MKAAFMRIFMEEPTVLLLDEPSNDMDVDTLKLLEEVILSWKGIVLYISHDETLIENTANMIIHIEQSARKTKCRYTVMRVPYREYVEQRLKGFEKQKKEAINERSEKKKMHAVKSMEKRFQREDENMTEMPETEDAIYFKLGDENSGIPAGKTVIEYSLDKLWTPDGSRILAQNIFLRIRGEEKICIIGSNGSGKTTLIKLINGLLVPTDGRILIDGAEPSVTTRNIVSYLPERTYLSDWMKVKEIVSYFKDFYENFDEKRAYEMLAHLQIDSNARLRTFSKGTKEKVQLILVMSRNADLYVLDEPIGGVDPAARDYILNTILTNYNENATILISTHLITDIENILDRVLFLQNGHIALNTSVDDIRIEHGKSVDTLFREVFRC